jgi:hypothetical protein
MGWECSTLRREDTCMQVLVRKTKDRDRFENLRRGVKIGTKYILVLENKRVRNEILWVRRGRAVCCSEHGHNALVPCNAGNLTN